MRERFRATIAGLTKGGSLPPDNSRGLLFQNIALKQNFSRRRPGHHRFSRNGRSHPLVVSGNGENLNGAFARNLISDLEFKPIPRWKRTLDITCVVLSLPCWLPLMVLVMTFVRINSPGPFFYRQERVGYQRRRFTLFKFRTMRVNSETQTHEEYFAGLMRSESPMTKLDATGDSRLIPGGRFLRASGLDELPQIFNVLRGEMSLVGPRPCLPNEFEGYKDWHKQRVFAPPGLTGYWQVNGKNNTTFQEMIEMDIHYIRKMSIWFDLKIILKTIPALIGQAKKLRSSLAEKGRREFVGTIIGVSSSANGYSPQM